MSLGILTSTLRALETIKDQRYLRFVGVGRESVPWLSAYYDSRDQKKTRCQLLRISAAVCGIELCYAAETAFVSPVLLRLGIPVAYMTLVWCLSPILGFFLVPFLGSLSDRCKSRLGRRRPFIILLSVGTVTGLLLVPNAEYLGVLFGDSGSVSVNTTHKSYRNKIINITKATNVHHVLSRSHLARQKNELATYAYTNLTHTETEVIRNSSEDQHFNMAATHVVGISILVVSVAMLDFSCDACQSPCRAYLLDVSIPADHTPGLTTFTLMAGLGGSIGYIVGGINWHGNRHGFSLTEHLQIVFSVVLVVYVICVALTLTSFKETPLAIDDNTGTPKKKDAGIKYERFTNDDTEDNNDNNIHADENHVADYGSFGLPKKMNKSRSEATTKSDVSCENSSSRVGDSHLRDHTVNAAHAQKTGDDSNDKKVTPKDDVQVGDARQVDFIEISTNVTLKSYLLSIVKIPKSVFVLCLTNLFCWMSLVCYSLYFTDFVGQCVYGGDPKAPRGSMSHAAYEDGVRLGSLSMALYSLSCSTYSLAIDSLIKRYRTKSVYICSQLVYTIGMVIVAVSRTKAAVVMMSATAGVMYATLFTMPYLIVAKYHAIGKFSENNHDDSNNHGVRGLGTDVAIVSSMVFLAQFFLSLCMGSVIHAVGSTVVVVIAASLLSFMGAVTASRVEYLDL